MFFLFSLSPAQTLRQAKGVDDFFHIFDLNQNKRLYSFGDRELIQEKLGYEEGGAASLTRIYMGDIIFQDNKTLIYAPHVYNGTVLKFKKTSDKNWEYASKIKGKEWSRPSFVDLEYKQDKDEYDTGRNIFRTVGSSGNTAGILNSRSVGLFKMTDNKIVHFTVTETEADHTFKQELHAEIFDQNLNYLGSDKLFEAGKEEVLWNVNSKANSDIFYLAIESSGYKARGLEFVLDIAKTQPGN